uniref:Membrane protein-like protein n=2 Tax=Ectopseudomonas TaxID=3236654 RepID=A4XWN0_ECTM1
MARAKKPLPSLDWLEPRLKLSRALSLLSFVALTALLLVWNLAFADLHGARIGVVLAIQLLPLALLAPGMLMGNARAHAWCCFVVNIYFIQGVLAAIDPARALFGVLEALISFNLFCTALLYTRWRFQYDRKLAGEA